MCQVKKLVIHNLQEFLLTVDWIFFLFELETSLMEVILEMISMEGVKWVNTVTSFIYAWVI